MSKVFNRGKIGVQIMTVLNRINYVRKQEGLVTLTRLLFDFFAKRLFVYGNYYLIEHNTNIGKEAEFLPGIKEYFSHFVTSVKDADKLLSAGYDIFSISINTRERLEKGAVAFIVLVGSDIAHIGWLALTEEAKNTFEPFPYRIDYQKDEACTGGTVTLPKYRGKGLMAYGMYKRLEFLREKGITKSRNIVSVKNTASLKVHAKFNHKIYARIRYFKFLWWHSWKEIAHNS
jgi:GNAT superfamily N-acetyltransferase